MITERTEVELESYLRSPEFRRRADELRPRVLEGVRTNMQISFDEMAEALDLPLDIVVGGFAHSMAKAGMPVIPVGRVQ